jgi:Secretion system C-terminal sorting domain
MAVQNLLNFYKFALNFNQFFMKKSPLFFALFMALFFAQNVFSQIIFVNKAATGSNNGTSWANAFTTLDAAISAAQTGNDIWITKDSYAPKAQIPAGKSSFHIKKAINLRGGFLGTETTLAQRIDGNLTILSGDLSNNDLIDEFFINRSDNTWHVVTVDSVVGAGAVLVERCRISGARADSSAANANTLQGRGGGIQARAKLEILDCHFSQNWALSGASIWVENPTISGAANGSSFKNCLFYQNAATEQSFGIHLRQLANVTIKNCLFNQNTGNRGGFYPFRCLNVTIDSCAFFNNISESGFGGAIFSWNSSYAVSNTVFDKNKAANAGAIYNDGRENLGTIITFKDVIFRENEATSATAFAGAVENWQASVYFTDCKFEKNLSRNVGAVYSDGRENLGSKVNFSGCLFDKNKADDDTGGAIYWWKCPGTVLNSVFEGNTADNGDGGWGGAAVVYGLGAEVEFDNCTFNNNIAGRSGGAITTAFMAKTFIKNSQFDGNIAGFGGCLYGQNDSTEVAFDNCTFTGNTALNQGGAININGGIKLEIANSGFAANVAPIGGAINFQEDSLDLANGNFLNCIFYQNVAAIQGGAINLIGANLEAANCLFNANLAGDGSNLGTGAGISNNATFGKTSLLNLTHCTFANNLGLQGSALSQWEDVSIPNTHAVANLTNNVFADAFNSYFIEAGAPSLISKGGNLSLDNSFLGAFNGINDVQNIDPQFLNLTDENFHLAAGSPCIDQGATTAGLTFDLDGLPRDAKPDRGCYEFQIVKTAETRQFSTFKMTPNPTTDFTSIKFESAENGLFLLNITNAVGQLLFSEMIEKADEVLEKRIDLSPYPQGIYLISLEKNGAKTGKLVVKN